MENVLGEGIFFPRDQLQGTHTCNATTQTDFQQGTLAENKTNYCEACGKTFKSETSLRLHIAKFANEKPFQCTICYHRFKCKENLYQHFKIHTQEKLHGCFVCDKKFANQFNLKRHMRVHTGEKPFQCTACQKCFKQADHLRNHHKTHSGERPYVCHLCAKKFKCNFNLKRHLSTHTGVKPFGCNICGKKFLFQSGLKYHLRIHNNGEVKGHQQQQPHVCDICECHFASKLLLNQHYASHLGNGEKSPYFRSGAAFPGDPKHCGKTQNDDDKKQCFFCAICGARFENSFSLHRHTCVDDKDMKLYKAVSAEVSPEQLFWRKTVSTTSV